MVTVSRTKKIAESYNERSTEYNAMSRTASPWLYFDKPYVQKNIVPLVTSRTRLLEIGSGSGKVIELFKGRIPDTHIVGVDLSKELVAIAKRNFPRATFVVGDFTKVPLLKSTFDIAVSVRSIEYLDPVGLTKAFRNVYSALKKNGKFFVLTGHPVRINDGDIATYLDRGPRSVSLPWGMEVNLYHKTISDILTAALSVGFRLEAINEPGVPLSLKKKNPEQYERYKSHGATNLHLVFGK